MAHFGSPLRTRVANGVSILFLAAALVLGLRTFMSRPSSEDPQAKRMDSLIGLRLDSVTISDGDGWHEVSLGQESLVIYAFETTCAACEFQKHHVAELLGSIHPKRVITLSREPISLTRNYWNSSLKPPLQLHPASLAKLGLTGVPTILVLKQGIVVDAWIGVITDWTSADILRQMEIAVN